MGDASGGSRKGCIKSLTPTELVCLVGGRWATPDEKPKKIGNLEEEHAGDCDRQHGHFWEMFDSSHQS